MTDFIETPLTGGNINTVVRVGNTVRRHMSRHSLTHHRLLSHLHANGFGAAPQVLGIDSKGREMLTFIEGQTTFPSDMWQSNAALVASAQMLRGFHDATAGFDTKGASWALVHPDISQHEVICHNDFAPYNMVFTQSVPTAILDFDLCGPGPRLRDLAYLAYWMAPLSFADETLAPVTRAQAAQDYPRLRALCAAYGETDMQNLLTWVQTVLQHMGDFAAMEQVLGKDTAKRLVTEGHLTHWQTEAAAFETALPQLRIDLN
ncbi:aminoglycoside phosphotransferase family protein [Shimia sp.]|uniref:aminoglycoside phosphotransferase family protein n=1 Tax=Shimia sp. TaxID=1954381 RepID=UPI003B8BE62B